ncbi:MAG: sigma-E factor negative regulatory protein RseB [Candidatus Azotimanducaceae bacterium]|jgi:sigma-E factor negative regulatory protein RseB
MLRVAQQLATAIVLMVVALHAHAGANDPVTWLQKMDRALTYENYEGTFTYSRDAQFNTIDVVHRYKEGKELSRLFYLNGEQKEILTVDEESTCQHINSDHVLFDHEFTPKPFSKAFSKSLASSPQFYRFTMLGRERFVGRPAVVIGVSPTYNDRVGYKLWLDEATGLLLQSHLMHRGRPLEVFRFTRVAIGREIRDELLVSSMTGDVVTHTVMQPTLEAAPSSTLDAPLNIAKESLNERKPGWKAAWLPSGFQQVMRPASDRVSYSDGVAAISIIVERVAVSADGEMVVARQGGTVLISRRLKGSNQQVTVVGEVPVETAKKIAESVEPVIY